VEGEEIFPLLQVLRAARSLARGLPEVELSVLGEDLVAHARREVVEELEVRLIMLEDVLLHGLRRVDRGLEPDLARDLFGDPRVGLLREGPRLPPALEPVVAR